MKTFFWVIALLAAIIAIPVFVIGMSLSDGAPQEAAVSAVALVIAIVPYCLARAMSEILGPDKSQA